MTQSNMHKIDHEIILSMQKWLIYGHILLILGPHEITTAYEKTLFENK